MANIEHLHATAYYILNDVRNAGKNKKFIERIARKMQRQISKYYSDSLYCKSMYNDITERLNKYNIL
jgi:hypothetical protein